MIPNRRKRKQRSEKPLSKILIKTNEEGRVEVYNKATGERLSNIRRVNIYVNPVSGVEAEITFKNVELEIEASVKTGKKD